MIRSAIFWGGTSIFFVGEGNCDLDLGAVKYLGRKGKSYHNTKQQVTDVFLLSKKHWSQLNLYIIS